MSKLHCSTNAFMVLLYRWKKYQDYIAEKEKKDMATNWFLDEFFDPVEHFAEKDSMQVKIKDSIIDYIIDASAPISVVENASFRKMISVCQPKFSHMSR